MGYLPGLDGIRALAVIGVLLLRGPQTPGEIRTRSGRMQLAELQAALGVPVVGMESPRGTGDPSLGAFAQMLARADAVLLLGKRLDFTLKFGQAPALGAATRWAQVDAEATEIDRTRRAVGARLQGTATAVPYEVFLALPYVVTLFALVIRARDSRTPSALAIPYVRGAR
jgi:thiamine pyrophosphate-dependent acetolactate synthase large subunit-like protein